MNPRRREGAKLSVLNTNDALYRPQGLSSVREWAQVHVGLMPVILRICCARGHVHDRRVSLASAMLLRDAALEVGRSGVSRAEITGKKVVAMVDRPRRIDCGRGDQSAVRPSERRRLGPPKSIMVRSQHAPLELWSCRCHRGSHSRVDKHCDLRSADGRDALPRARPIRLSCCCRGDRPQALTVR